MVAVSFITVTMNSISTIDSLFSSFFKTVDRSINYEYIVVDNCSTDGTVEFIMENYPEVKVLKTDKIKGFAENNNLGIKVAQGKVIALINPDIIFLPDSVEPILTYMNDRLDIGLIGPLLLNKDGSVQDSARRFLNIKTASLRLLTLGNDKVPVKQIQHYLKSYDPNRESQLVDWVIGAVMFVRAEALKRVGMLDENFFLYIEDQDWCFQMWKHGYKVAYFTRSKFIHDHQRSSARKISKKTLWHIQSLCYFLRKNYLSILGTNQESKSVA